MTGSVTFTACEDIDDIKELNLDRLLSPTNLTARVRDKVNIELTWDEMDRAQSYVIEVFKEDPDFTGTAISTLESEKATYTVTGLEGETSYSIRVKSVAEGITDSKWVSATVQQMQNNSSGSCRRRSDSIRSNTSLARRTSCYGNHHNSK